MDTSLSCAQGLPAQRADLLVDVGERLVPVGQATPQILVVSQGKLQHLVEVFPAKERRQLAGDDQGHGGIPGQLSLGVEGDVGAAVDDEALETTLGGDAIKVRPLREPGEDKIKQKRVLDNCSDTEWAGYP